MLKIDVCKKILNANSRGYKDSEVEKLRDFLVSLAKIEMSIISKK